jgi:hypothetical protein
MADQKLTDKIGLTTLTDADLFHVVDVSDTSGDALGTSKKGVFSLIKSTLKSYFDTIYTVIGTRPRTITTANIATSYSLDMSLGLRFDLTMTANTTLSIANLIADGDTNQIYLTPATFALTLPAYFTAYPNSEDISGATLAMIVFDVMNDGAGAEKVRYNATVVI